MSIKISELPEATSVTNEDEIPIVQTGTTKKVLFSKIKEMMGRKITELNASNDIMAYFDDNFKPNDAPSTLKLTEGIYYIKPTSSSIRLAISYDISTSQYQYYNLPFGSYIMVFEVQVVTGPLIDESRRYYEYIVFHRNVEMPEIEVKMSVASLSSFLNTYKSYECKIEDTRHKVTSIDDNSTDLQYPSAKVVQDKYNFLLDQIPTATATGETINVQDSSNLSLKEFDLLGNATQETTSISGGDEYDSPSPDHPQDIHVVTGDNTVEVLGKNLLPYPYTNSSYTENGVTFTVNSDGSIKINGTASADTYFALFDSTHLLTMKAGTYTRFLISSVADYNSYIGFQCRKDSVAGADIFGSTMNKYKSTTLTEDTKVYVRLRAYNGAVFNNVVFYPMFVAGTSTSETYEPYTEQTQLLSLGNIELAKIGDYTDRIFKSSGKWYVEKQVGKVTLDGNSTVTRGNTNENYTSFYIADDSVAFSTPCLANYFTYDSVLNHIMLAQNEGITTHNTVHRIYLAITTTKASTVADFKTWLGTHNTIVYYILATPTTTEITDTTLIGQLENVLKMHTNKNVTNAWIEPAGTNAQGGMKLVYRRDIQIVINNLQNQIDIIST